LQTPQVPPALQCAQPLQFLHAVQGSEPVQPRPANALRGAATNAAMARRENSGFMGSATSAQMTADWKSRTLAQ
jgi:hypothetical protein